MARFVSKRLLRGIRNCVVRQRSLSVYGSAHSYNEDEIKEKLQRFPGGTVELRKGGDGIAVLTVNNPSRMNAFTGTMIIQLKDRVVELEEWTDGKGLILHGAANTFCSGSDLNAVRAISNPQDGMQMCMLMQNTLTRLMRLPLISVALIQGKAVGGGAELTTACDFRLMTPGSEIRFVHKHMGLVPGWGGATRLVHIVGSRQALRLLSTAQKVDPERGLQMGLADEMLSSSNESESLAEAMDWIRQYTKGPSQVIRALKKVVISGRELPLEDALRKEKDIFGTVWGGPANLEALAQGAKQRQPQ
ncbi:ethylmalonyl-CoA decarboxylase isoform X2 [Latimeria chalumnae]|nr:PREDICTED: ethylmalonyl-CoA decarboxylase isoform X2 [Latimeria chalumnae]|eukprot:XP_006006806.1 PREDICTED: ethylmalonyl-CoA decarboxylase isoform X2 [Latimeria chalumnae]